MSAPALQCHGVSTSRPVSGPGLSPVTVSRGVLNVGCAGPPFLVTPRRWEFLESK